jgi:GNAT superfamily N-acetyltransferase
VGDGVTFIELDASPGGLRTLKQFYNALYVEQFPDPHERESAGNMARYLALKARGWYGANNYHVLLMQRGPKLVGGSVSDYFAKPNAGVIEFLFTRPDQRRRGLGRALFDATVRLLQRDARAACGKPLAGVVAEMNDPLQSPGTPDNMDPFVRAGIFAKWGFGRMAFPYVQPALSAKQRPVESLALLAKLPRGARRQVRSKWVMGVVGDYMRWAMRIPRPSSNEQYKRMQHYAAAHPIIAVVPLRRHTGS